jgi:hypothetical protein
VICGGGRSRVAISWRGFLVTIPHEVMTSVIFSWTKGNQDWNFLAVVLFVAVAVTFCLMMTPSSMRVEGRLFCGSSRLSHYDLGLGTGSGENNVFGSG